MRFPNNGVGYTPLNRTCCIFLNINTMWQKKLVFIFKICWWYKSNCTFLDCFFPTWKNKETWIEYAYILICFHLKCCSKFFGFSFFLPRQRTCINIHILIFLIGNTFFICLGWPLFTKTVYVHKYSYSDIFYLKYCFIFFGVAFIYQDSVCA